MADKGDIVGTDLSSSDGPTTTRSSSSYGSSSAPNNTNRRRNKRKRKHQSTVPLNENNEDATATTSCNGSIFNGLIVAISALESKHDKTNEVTTVNDTGDDTYQNYKTLKQLLQALGATISPQVHKRVHYLISTDSAIQNLTQRVRQAAKRKVDVVDVAWVKDCREKGTRIKVDNYLCNDLVECLVAEKEKRDRGSMKLCTSSDVGPDDLGWSSPIELDCCCVCHENGDDECPWCIGPDCNLTLARKAKAARQTE